MRKIEITTDTLTEFELGDTAADIERRREERGLPVEKIYKQLQPLSERCTKENEIEAELDSG